MVATAVGTTTTRGEVRVLQWDDSEIQLVIDSEQLAIKDGQRVRVTGALEIHREGAPTVFVMTANEVVVIGP